MVHFWVLACNVEEQARAPARYVVYLLVSDESKLEAAFGFKNESFAHCTLWTTGSPLYSEPQPTNVVDVAEGLLQRYQTYTGAPDFEGIRDFEGMRNILDKVDATENVTATLGNVKLEVTSEPVYTIFQWGYTLNGVDFPGITLEFRKGMFCELNDVWSIYRVGSTDVNVSREEAINIALKHVETFSWNVSMGDNNPPLEVTDFNILEEQSTAELITTRSREPLTM